MKTIYESFLELSQKTETLEEEIFKDRFFRYLDFFLNNYNYSIEEINFLKKLDSYQEKISYLENLLKKKKLNYYDKISMDYLNKIRNL
jgi:hypothetical protein